MAWAAGVSASAAQCCDEDCAAMSVRVHRVPADLERKAVA